eukprot:558486-Alexandrium_andersonii.AAC.1
MADESRGPELLAGYLGGQDWPEEVPALDPPATLEAAPDAMRDEAAAVVEREIALAAAAAATDPQPPPPT